MRIKWYTIPVITAIVGIILSFYIALGRVGWVKEFNLMLLDLLEKDKIPYQEMISDCRLLASPACISRYAQTGYAKLADRNRTIYLIAAEDIVSTAVEHYPATEAAGFYQGTVVRQKGGSIPQIANMGSTAPIPFYQTVIDESFKHDINPELLLILMQMTSGIVQGQLDTYPAVLDLGQQDVQTETALLANKLHEAYENYTFLLKENRFDKLKKRFTTHSIEYAIDTHALNAASLAYLDVMDQLYGNKSYYAHLVDIRFQNPSSFRNIYMYYLASDPRRGPKKSE